MAVADIILKQLGGSRFTSMTGAKNLVGDTNSLAFKLPKAVKNKIELKNLKKFISRADCKRSTLFFLVYLVGFDIVLFEFDDLTDDEDFQNDWWLGKPVPNQEIAVF